MPAWLVAGLWGLVSGSALVMGAALGFFTRVPRRLVAVVMAFGSGVLISALSFDLMEEAQERGGLLATSAGFLLGALVFTGANALLELRSRRAADERKSAGPEQPSEEEEHGSGATIALGAILDAIPESIVIGLSLLEGGAVSAVAVAAVFLSNFPEGLASATGMRKAGRSALYVFGIWGGIALVSGLAALLGNLLFGDFPPSIVAATTAIAAGAILAMLVDTMIPEAVLVTRNVTGLIAVVGFLLAFLVSRLT